MVFEPRTGTKEDAFHYCYEMKMLFGALNLSEELLSKYPVRHFPKEPKVATTRNIFINSVVLHARVLIGFFDERKWSDDIVVKDFIPTWESKGPHWVRLAALKTDMDKRLAHLTQGRHVDFEGWNLLEIAGDLFSLNATLTQRLHAEHPEMLLWFDDAAMTGQLFSSDFASSYAAGLAAEKPDPTTLIGSTTDTLITIQTNRIDWSQDGHKSP